MSQVEIKGPPARARRRRRLLWNTAGLFIALLMRDRSGLVLG